MRLLCALRSAERCQGIYATAEWFATNGNLQKILRHALLEHSSYREYNLGGTMHCVVTHCGLCVGVMPGFVIAGHSLGAGISSTLALLWYRRHTFVDTVSNGRCGACFCACLTFASPFTGPCPARVCYRAAGCIRSGRGQRCVGAAPGHVGRARRRRRAPTVTAICGRAG